MSRREGEHGPEVVTGNEFIMVCVERAGARRFDGGGVIRTHLIIEGRGLSADHHVGEGSDRRPSSREGVWPPRAILTLVNTRHATAHISSPSRQADHGMNSLNTTSLHYLALLGSLPMILLTILFNPRLLPQSEAREAECFVRCVFSTFHTIHTFERSTTSSREGVWAATSM